MTQSPIPPLSLIDVITLLPGAGEAGLQILDHDRRRLPIFPPPGCITDVVPNRHPSPITADGYLQRRRRATGLLLPGAEA